MTEIKSVGLTPCLSESSVADVDDAPTDELALNLDSVSVISKAVDNSAADDSTTYLTIQLPDGMQGSTLSNQKLQDLILQLSQSGQIQLREDSKIVIDLKFTMRPENQQTISKESPKYGTPSTFNTTTPNIVTVASPGVRTIQLNSQGVNNVTIKQEVARTLSGVTTTHHTAGQVQARQNAQQPAYILVPATHLPNSGTGQGYHVSSQIRNASSGSNILRGSNLSGAVTLNSADRSYIFLQQPMTTGANTNSIMVNHGGTNTLLPLRHLSTVGTGGIGSFGTGATLVAGNTATVNGRLTGVSGGDLYGSGGSRPTQRESTWQQYVKQFTKLGPCPICGDKISGYHYGIFCCESCKGFFKRTVQNSKRYSCHRPTANALCEINIASRKKCPACRFVKCVDKGMRIEAIRSDRTRGGRSMYPGSRYLRQIAARVNNNRSIGQFASSNTDLSGTGLSLFGGKDADSDQLACAVVGLSGDQPTLGPDGLPASEDAGGGVFLDPGVLGTHGDDEDDDPNSRSLHVDQPLLNYQTGAGPGISRLNSGSTGPAEAIDSLGGTRIELPKALNDILFVEESMQSEPEDVLELEASGAEVADDEAAVYRALLKLADQRLYRTVRWSRALPDFSQLDTDDQILLLQNCWADLLCLDCCWRSLPTPTEIRLTSSKCINLEAARELGAEEIVERMLLLTQKLTQLRLDVVEFCCLKVIVLMRPDLQNLKAAAHVRAYRDMVNKLLSNYISQSSPNMLDKFTRLMQCIPELQHASETARLMLVDIDLSAYLSSNSLLMELLRSDIQRHAPASAASDNEDEAATTEPEAPALPTHEPAFIDDGQTGTTSVMETIPVSNPHIAYEPVGSSTDVAEEADALDD